LTYATVSMVKRRMRIQATDTGRDADIEAAITFGDAFCNGAIKANGGGTPVLIPPTELKEAAADLAAYYLFRSSNPTTASLYYDSGKTLLMNYVSGNLTTFGVNQSGKSGVRDDE